MKAITLRQPWASLIAADVKQVETRSWATKHRGRIAIHAGKAWDRGWLRWYEPDDDRLAVLTDLAQADCYEDSNGSGYYRADRRSLPLGAIVATARLVDCVPIVETGEEGAIRTVQVDPNGSLWLVEPQTDEQVAAGETPEWREITDQRPFGDFTLGRYAWLLDDIKPTRERCPWCWDRAWAEDRNCPACDNTGRCDPIPARGRQGLWEWTP